MMSTPDQKLLSYQPINIRLNFVKGAYLLICGISVFYFAVMNPFYNWDVIGYVASAYEFSGLSGEALRDATYDDIRNIVPPDLFLSLTAESRVYRSTVYEDASALQQQLPFYRIRYAYVWTTYALGQLTGSFSQATALISAAAGFLIVFVSGIFFWRAQSTIAFFFAPPAVAVGGVITISRLSTADAISALAAISLFAAIQSKRHLAAALLIALLPIFRTDYLILSVAASIILFSQRHPRLAALSVFLSVSVYLLVNHFAQNYGHAVIFNFTLISGPQPYPASMLVSEDVRDYARAYMRGVMVLIQQPAIFLYPAIYTLALIFVISRQRQHQNRFLQIFFAALFFVVAHFLLFPAAFGRNYFILTWASLMYLAEAYSISRNSAHEPTSTPK